MRKGIALWLAVVLTLGMWHGIVRTHAEANEIKVEVNGKAVDFPDAKPFINAKTGRVLVPVRFVGESLGVQVEWLEEKKIVKMEFKGMRIDLPVGKTVVDTPQVTYRFDTPAVIVDDRVFVPLRFVSEAFGAKVTWDGKLRKVQVWPENNPVWMLKLQKKHPETQPAVNAFVNSIKINGNKVTGTIPKLPKGYTFSLRYTDRSDGNWGNRELDFNNLEKKYSQGKIFTITFTGEGGYITYDVWKEGVVGVNGCTIYIPSLSTRWVAER